MNTDPSKRWKATALGLAAVLAVIAALPALTGPATANHKPADKAAVSSSNIEIMSASVSNGSFSEEHTLMTSTVKTSSPTDLVFQLTAECALWTDVTTIGNDQSHALAQVEVWIEVDGDPVPVSTTEADGADDGHVVLCNRDYKVQTLQFDDEDATIKRYLSSRTANAFNWITLNVGDGTHEIVVKGQLTGEASEDGRAKAAVGQRTLVIEPVKLANDVNL